MARLLDSFYMRRKVAIDLETPSLNEGGPKKK